MVQQRCRERGEVRDPSAGDRTALHRLARDKELLETQRRACLDICVHGLRRSVAEPVRCSLWDTHDVSGPCDEVTASDAELHLPCEHGELLLLTRMRMTGGNVFARGEEEIEAQQCAVRVASAATNDDALATDRVLDDSHHSARRTEGVTT